MVLQSLLVVSLATYHLVSGDISVNHTTLALAAERILNEENESLRQACTRAVYTSWYYQTNLTEINRRIAYKNVLSIMSETYNTATICGYQGARKCDLSIDRDISPLMVNSRDASELSHAWKTWRDNTGKKIRNHFSIFVELANKAARYNGFRNVVEMDLVPYERPDFRQEIANAWEQIKPLYLQLHAYARSKLRKVYGSSIVRERGPLPAHILGNMWAQKWDVNDILMPYPWKPQIDVTNEMVKQRFTPKKLFEVAEDFFLSMNMTRMPHTFWRHSMFEAPNDRPIICHASSWDFCNSYDYRVKVCSSVTMEDLVTAHREMTHVQYFLQYRDQPYLFRGGANPGFHEAVAGAVALSASTSNHFHRIGLIKYHYNNQAEDINSLMEMALDKVVFLPYAYAMDKWRWDVLDGSLTEKDWNCGWWDLAYEIQGIKPPDVRTEDDFDPASKFNVIANHPYDKYFVGFILQFQMYKALCMKAGAYNPVDKNKPLHKCDFSQSLEAGDALREMMSVGSSKPWGEVLASLTGQDKLDGTALREYFEPLEEWLKYVNERSHEFVGWKPDAEYCVYREPEDAPTRVSCNN